MKASFLPEFLTGDFIVASAVLQKGSALERPEEERSSTHRHPAACRPKDLLDPAGPALKSATKLSLPLPSSM